MIERLEESALKIKTIRTKLGLTMKEFGQKFDPPASDSIVSRWERGISVPNNARLRKIAELGEVSMDAEMNMQKQECPACSFVFFMEKEKVAISKRMHGGPYCGRCGSKVLGATKL